LPTGTAVFAESGEANRSAARRPRQRSPFFQKDQKRQQCVVCLPGERIHNSTLQHSITILTDGCTNFRRFLVEGTKPNLKKINEMSSAC